MMCSTIISKLGFECHPLGETFRIISPFTYCDDGEHVGAFVREINGKFLISDRSDAIFNMESRGISLNKKRISDIEFLLKREGTEINERGEIFAWATEENIGKVTSSIIRAGILASTLSLDWYPSVRTEKFESQVIDFFYHSEIRDNLSIRDDVWGASGHKISVPITIKARIPKLVFTSSVKENGSWNAAYSLLGKLIDLKNDSDSINNRYVVIDNDSIGNQVEQLALLFNDSSQVLPFSKRKSWISKLVA